MEMRVAAVAAVESGGGRKVVGGERQWRVEMRVREWCEQ